MAKRIRWTYEMVAEIASAYTSVGTFKKEEPKAYDAAIRNKWLDGLNLSRQNKPNGFWTIEKIYEVALTYENKTVFMDNEPTAYSMAAKAEILDEVCSHMPDLRRKWTVGNLTELALGFDSKNDFKQAHRGAYWSADDLGVLDDICSHMNRKVTKSNVIYLWGIPNTNIYKIGVTSNHLGTARIVQVANRMGVDYEVVGMYEIENAVEIETELHNTYQIVPTTLPKKDGHTEFRILTTSDVNEITYYLENVVGKKVTTK